tara:strand:- start:238 stop:588 length:351 start_codon:yes stop_codon:yes gene_type:complete
MNLIKKTTTKINSKKTIFMSAYYFNFHNFLRNFKVLVFLMIAGTLSFSLAVKSEDNSTLTAKSEDNSTNKNIYESIFDSYEKWEWEDTTDWIFSNKIVDEIGGWQYYSREKSEEKK